MLQSADLAPKHIIIPIEVHCVGAQQMLPRQTAATAIGVQQQHAHSTDSHALICVQQCEHLGNEVQHMK